MDITTTKEFDEIINDTDKKAVLIDFWAPWCGPCRMLTPTITQLSKSYPNNVYKVNVDVQKEIAMRFGIRGTRSTTADSIFRKIKILHELINSSLHHLHLKL